MITSKPLSLVVQLLRLQQMWPAGRGDIRSSAEGRRLRWHQSIRPHALCGLYEIELRFAEGHRPLVLVKAPDLKSLASGRKLPHTFADVDDLPSLCLWWKNDWRNTQLVASTVIPWTAEWFWFFEHWLSTGEWLGGGTHPVKVVPPNILSATQPTPAIKNAA